MISAKNSLWGGAQSNNNLFAIEETVNVVPIVQRKSYKFELN